MNKDQSDEISDRDTMGELADTPRTDARCAESQQLKTMAMRFAWMCDHARTLERELAMEVAANEAGRVVDAMTPEQVDAYLVSMGVNLDEMRAHTEQMRQKLTARFSSPNTQGLTPRAKPEGCQ